MSALTDYVKSTFETDQTSPAPGRAQVQNNAGGYGFKASDKTRLERFLILGTDGGTYYASEQKLTADNATFIRELIQKDPAFVLNTLVDVSINGRAYKQSPAIFTLALLVTDSNIDLKIEFLQVIRTSTHLFEFVSYLNDLGGWGRSKRTLVSSWYLSKTPEQLAYQVAKYRSRSI